LAVFKKIKNQYFNSQSPNLEGVECEEQLVKSGGKERRKGPNSEGENNN
jgi:hypothetical protein